MNYTELKTNIADYLHRTDLGSKLDTFIALAEAFLFRELNVPELEISVTGTSTGGTIAIPADFGTLSRLTITHAGREIDLDHATLGYPINFSGHPCGYSMQDGVITVSPAPDASYPYTLHYTPVLTPLSDVAPTNWLIKKAPDLYLLACQYQGAKYVGDMTTLQILVGEMAPLLDSVQRLTKRRQALRGSLQIRTR